jgi:alpha-galactosidase
MADRMAEDGYLKAGYEYVHIDDCWMERKRDDKGLLVSDAKRFPSGIRKLSEYV